jgi:hypothetical protein
MSVLRHVRRNSPTFTHGNFRGADAYKKSTVGFRLLFMNRLTTQLKRLQVFARLESDCLTGRNVYFGSRSRVSPNAGLSRLDGEYSKTPQFNPIVGFQRIFHTVEDRIYSLLGFGFADACSFHDLINKIQLDHGQPPRNRYLVYHHIFTTHEGI